MNARRSCRRCAGAFEPRAHVRILGIDPGLRVTGFGLIERTGRSFVYVDERLHPHPRGGELPDAARNRSSKA